MVKSMYYGSSYEECGNINEFLSSLRVLILLLMVETTYYDENYHVGRDIISEFPSSLPLMMLLLMIVGTYYIDNYYVGCNNNKVSSSTTQTILFLTELLVLQSYYHDGNYYAGSLLYLLHSSTILMFDNT